MSIINKLIVLKLNKNWQPVGYSTVGKAIVDLAGGISAQALDLQYEVDGDGEPVGDPIAMVPTNWEEWVDLPVRPYDLVVHYGSHGSKSMRVPTVLIARNFAEMPKKHFKGKPSKDGIWIRDGGICQYSGRPLTKAEATIDHVLPRARGGKDTWENEVLSAKDINTKKGDKLNSEIGLKLIRLPKVPRPIPLCNLIREARHRDWKPFLANNVVVGV
jgi:5-methylcytosine-specific restriction endonuclease McrA